MVQKKDTISYTEFIRGKYDVNNLKYLYMLFGSMTTTEKEQLNELDFKSIWNNLWTNVDTDSKFQREYNKSAEKFYKLKTGFIMARLDGTLQTINVDHLVKTSQCITEQEWEFPKGRRKLHESDIDCSVREFFEEAGLQENIFVHDFNKQYEETFQGTNSVRYRNIYYIAQYVGDTSLLRFDADNINQVKEVRDVGWFSYNDVIRNISNRNSEKIELFKRVNNIIKKI